MNQRAEPPGVRIRPNAFAHLAHFSARHCIAVLMAFLGVAAMALGYAVVELDGDLDRRPSIAITAGVATAQTELDRAFPGIDTTYVARIEATDPAVARRVALAAASRLSKSGLFSIVFVPGTGAFYETYGFLFLDSRDIVARVNRALAMQPLFQALAAAPDLAGLAALTAGMARSIELGHSPRGLEGLLRRAALTVKGEAEGKPHPLSWTDLAGLKAEPNSTRWFVIAQPAEGKADLAQTAAEAVRPEGAAVSWIFPAGQRPPPDSFAQSYGVPGAIAFLLFAIVAGLTLGGVSRSLAVMLAGTISMSVGAGAAALRGPDLDAASWAFAWAAGAPSLLLAVVMVLAFAEARARGLRKTAALAVAAQLRGMTVLAFGSMTLAFWLAWLPGSLSAMADLAIVATLATGAGVLGALIVVPAALAVFEATPGKVSPHWLDRLLARPASYHWGRARQIIAVMLIAAAAFCSVFVPAIEFGESTPPVADTSPDTPAAPGAVHLLSPPGAPAHRLIERIGRLPETGAIRWIEQFLPLDVAQKRRSLRALSGYVGGTPQVLLPAQTAAEIFEALQANLLAIANAGQASAELRAAAHLLRRSLSQFSNSREAGADRVAALESALFRGFGDLPATAAALSQLGQPGIGEIDENLRRRFVDAQGRWRIEVLHRPGVSPHGFARALRKLGAAGPPIVSLDRAETYRRAAVLALLPGFGIASVIALFVLRRVDEWVAAILPVLLTMALTAAVLVGWGMTVSANVLAAATIAAALSLSSTVMLALRLRYARHDPCSTGMRAALAPLLLCLAATVPLTLSSRPPIAEFGAAMALFLGTATMVNLALVPQLLAWLGRRPR